MDYISITQFAEIVFKKLFIFRNLALPLGLRPQARFGAQPLKAALSAEMSCQRKLTERALSAPAGHLPQRGRQGGFLDFKSLTFSSLLAFSPFLC
jgi:hypothetical protein